MTRTRISEWVALLNVRDGGEPTFADAANGEAVKRAFHGEIEDHFEKDGYFVRVSWSREA
jgi:hypothetical protein